jgi:hypothetical protein
MALDFDVTKQSQSVSDGVSDLDRAYKQIRDAILLGIPGTKPTCIGAVFPGQLGITAEPRQVGAAKVTSRYQCSRTKRWYQSKKECEKNCKPKSTKKKPAAGPITDLLARLAPSSGCTGNVKVKIKFRVERKYKLTVRMVVMEWLVRIGKPEARKLVRSWNDGIVEHEYQHADDIRDVATRTLPEFMKYEITGEGDSEAAARANAKTNLEDEIEGDNSHIERIFRNAIERRAGALDILKERSLPLPTLSSLR